MSEKAAQLMCNLHRYKYILKQENIEARAVADGVVE
jgi:hypothetical protein